MALTARLDGTYQRKMPLPQGGFTLSPVRWRYIVDGTPEEIKEYKDSSDQIVTNDDGKTLFFSRNYHGDQVTLVKAMTTGRFFPERNEQLEKLKSLASQNDGDVGAALASLVAGEMLKSIRPTAPVVRPTADDEDLTGEKKKDPAIDE